MTKFPFLAALGASLLLAGCGNSGSSAPSANDSLTNNTKATTDNTEAVKAATAASSADVTAMKSALSELSGKVSALNDKMNGIKGKTPLVLTNFTCQPSNTTEQADVCFRNYCNTIGYNSITAMKVDGGPYTGSFTCYQKD